MRLIFGWTAFRDEPGFLPSFLYNYAGRPDKTVDRTLKILRSDFSPTIGGLPGNDDSGESSQTH
jgi:putative alpha-1,2-mannosidase